RHRIQRQVGQVRVVDQNGLDDQGGVRGVRGQPGQELVPRHLGPVPEPVIPVLVGQVPPLLRSPATLAGGQFHSQVHRGQRGEVLRSEEHTSELQSREKLVCRLLLEKKKKYNTIMFSFMI